MKKLIILLLLSLTTILCHAQYHAGIGGGRSTKAYMAFMESGWLFYKPLINVQGEMRIHLSTSSSIPVYAGVNLGKGFAVGEHVIMPNVGYYYGIRSSDRPEENSWNFGAGISYWSKHVKYSTFYQERIFEFGITIFCLVTRY